MNQAILIKQKQTTILFIIPVILLISGKLFAYLDLKTAPLLILGATFFMAVYTVVLIRDTGKRHYWHQTVLVANLVLVLGSIFKVMHWIGGGVLFLTGYTVFLIAPFLLIWTSLRNEKRQFQLFQLLAGILMLLQVVIPAFSLSSDTIAAAQLLNYPLAGIIGTILINGTEIHQGEKNMLRVILLSSIFFIIKHTFSLLTGTQKLGNIEKMLF